METSDKKMIENPPHYNQGKIEVIEFIEDQKLSYHLGNAIKYISRCDHKGKKKQDLEKAIWYLRRELELLNPEPRRPNNMSDKYEPTTFEPSAYEEEKDLTSHCPKCNYTYFTNKSYMVEGVEFQCKKCSKCGWSY